MAVSRHLGYYQTGNSIIRSADPEKPCLEPDMEWIGCTVCEIFASKLYCNLETGVLGHSKSSKVALFDRAHTTFVFVFHSNYASIYYPFLDMHIGRKLLPPCIWRPRWGWSRQIYATTLGDEKLNWWAYQTVKEFRWYVQPFWHNTRVWQTDRRTDGIGVAYTRYSIYAVARKKSRSMDHG